MFLGPCDINAAERHCAAAQGLPSGPLTQTGTDDPEGNVVGYVVGGHFYFRTSTNKLYVFGGVARETTGWEILN